MSTLAVEAVAPAKKLLAMPPQHYSDCCALCPCRSDCCVCTGAYRCVPAFLQQHQNRPSLGCRESECSIPEGPVGAFIELSYRIEISYRIVTLQTPR